MNGYSTKNTSDSALISGQGYLLPAKTVSVFQILQLRLRHCQPKGSDNVAPSERSNLAASYPARPIYWRGFEAYTPIERCRSGKSGKGHCLTRLSNITSYSWDKASLKLPAHVVRALLT